MVFNLETAPRFSLNAPAPAIGEVPKLTRRESVDQDKLMAGWVAQHADNHLATERAKLDNSRRYAFGLASRTKILMVLVAILLCAVIGLSIALAITVQKKDKKEQ